MADKINILGDAGYKATFGEFEFVNTTGGRIRITSQDWIDNNIVLATLKDADGPGRTVVAECHRLAKIPLERVFAEISAKGLSSLINNFDGLWVQRHMQWKNSKPISSHSWGIAVDLNATSNPQGSQPTNSNRKLNEVFNRYGFAWGGDFNGDSADGMHWELAKPDAHLTVSAFQARLILAVARGGQLSYHALASARKEDGVFTAARAEVADILNAPDGPDVRMPIRDLLRNLGATIFDEGNFLADAENPRFFLFVQPAV